MAISELTKRALVALTLPAALALGACGGEAAAQPEAAPSSSPSPSLSATPSNMPTPTRDPGTYDEGYAAAQADYADPAVEEARHPQVDRSDEWNEGYLDGWHAAFDADTPTVDPKQAKRDKAVRARVKASKHVKAWTKNMRSKSALAGDFNAGDAAVNVCWDVSNGKTDDEAAEFFADVYLDKAAIKEWSPVPDVTVEAFAQSFVSEVLYSEHTSMCKN